MASKSVKVLLSGDFTNPNVVVAKVRKALRDLGVQVSIRKVPSKFEDERSYTLSLVEPPTYADLLMKSEKAHGKTISKKAVEKANAEFLKRNPRVSALFKRAKNSGGAT